MTTRREGKRPAGWAAEGSARKMQREETGSSGRMEVEPGAAEKGMPSSEGSSPFETVVGFVTGLLPNHGASSTIDSKLATRSVMMDNPPAGKGTADGPAVDTGSRARGPKLSRRQLRQCGLPKVVHAEGCTFKDFIPLHHLWIKYAPSPCFASLRGVYPAWVWGKGRLGCRDLRPFLLMNRSLFLCACRYPVTVDARYLLLRRSLSNSRSGHPLSML
jgi:hypothetical protein